MLSSSSKQLLVKGYSGVVSSELAYLTSSSVVSSSLVLNNNKRNYITKNKTTSSSPSSSTVSYKLNSYNHKTISSPLTSFNNVRYYSTAGKPIQFKLADIGEGIAECEILKWSFKVGDKVKEFDQLCEVQSDKATVEITSRYDGTITKLYYNVGDMAKVGSPLCDILVEGGESAPAEAPKAEAAKPAPSSSNASHSNVNHQENEITVNGTKLKVLATPSVRNMAKVNNIDLKQVVGNGKDGRVLKEDIVTFMNGGQQKQVKPTVASQPPTQQAPVQAPKPFVMGGETRIPITGIKKVMVKTMTAAASVPHFGFCEEYIMDGLMSLRSQLKPLAEQRGIKLSYMPFIIKATSLALLKYPQLNASFNETEIIQKHYHNIGVAMDTPQGLLVPNIKNVESKSIFEIAQELNRLQKVGLAGQLTPADMSGGTFSLSNIGTIGGTYASPVLLLPEVAIGAIGKIQKLPRYDKFNNVVPVNIMQISWSADHRAIDGATMANFSNLLKQYMENPNTMLFDTK